MGAFISGADVTSYAVSLKKILQSNRVSMKNFR